MKNVSSLFDYAIEHSMSSASYQQSSSNLDHSNAYVWGNYSVGSIQQLSPFTQSITCIFFFGFSSFFVQIASLAHIIYTMKYRMSFSFFIFSRFFPSFKVFCLWLWNLQVFLLIMNADDTFFYYFYSYVLVEKKEEIKLE